MGMWINLCDPGVAQLAAVAGYDWVMIDMEHNPLTEGQVQGLLHAISGEEVTTVVRARANRQEHVSWILDAGAGGVLMPGIVDAADARKAVQICKYHPLGMRGYGPNRATGFWTNVVEYNARANEDILLICQIELASAVAEIEEICQISGIDGLFIGPTDLAQSMGHLADPAHADVQAAIDRIIDTCNRHGKCWGIPAATIDEYQRYVERLAVLVLLGSDTGMIKAGAAALAAGAREVLDRSGLRK